MESQEHTKYSGQSKLAKSNHDIRASLAITNGFNQALESSFSDLCSAVEQLVRDREIRTDEDEALIHHVAKLEADCWFCLSRINRSLTQLGTRIEKESDMHGHAQSSGSLES